MMANVVLLLSVVGCATASCPGDAPVKTPTTNGKFLFAHYMIFSPSTNSTMAGFQRDILLAQSAGIDGFALNLAVWSGSPVYRQRATLIFDAADQLNTGFQLMFSLDMSKNMPQADIVSILTTFSSRSSQAYRNGKQMLSTFVGQAIPGVGNVSNWWASAFSQASFITGKGVYFIPFFVPSGGNSTTGLPRVIDVTNIIDKYPVVDGLFSWNLLGYPNPSKGLGKLLGATIPDNEVNYRLGCNQRSRAFMASIGPWFSTHDRPKYILRRCFLTIVH